VSDFPDTVPGLLAWRAARDPQAPWLFFEGRTWTLRDVCAEVERYAVALQARGVTKGDRVAVLLGNTPETLFSWFATNHLGAIAAIVNPAHKPAELTGIFGLVSPRVIVVDALRATVKASLDGWLSAEKPMLVAPAELEGKGPPPPAQAEPDDVCVLIPTSGTTGAPKAVMQTHRTYALTAEAFPDWLGLQHDDRLLAAMPLFHINAQAYSTMGALASGSLALLRRFSASRFWEEAAALGATQFNSVGAMLHILLRVEPRRADREHTLRSCYAALALPEATHRAFEDRFGVSLSVGYGMSETTYGTIWPRGEARDARAYGTMGRLRQHPRLGEVNRARVVRDDGTEAASGEAGELWLQNPATMAGYFGDPAATARALDGGWLRTGDLVRRDERGTFTFVSRRKEMLRRRGENVAAAEIEAVLAAFPGVQEVAVVGVPSDLGEDDIVAYVVPVPGAPLESDALIAWAKSRLADFKIPRTIEVRDALPHTATGRIAKHLLA
jgi:crotonobetaine/carnitine-CoA ligase